jgi:exonuclease VII large subunit
VAPFITGVGPSRSASHPDTGADRIAPTPTCANASELWRSDNPSPTVK